MVYKATLPLIICHWMASMLVPVWGYGHFCTGFYVNISFDFYGVLSRVQFLGLMVVSCLGVKKNMPVFQISSNIWYSH